MIGLGDLRRGFRLGQRFLRGLGRGGERREIAKAAGGLRQAGGFGFELRDFLVEPGDAVAMGANVASIWPRRAVSAASSVVSSPNMRSASASVASASLTR